MGLTVICRGERRNWTKCHAEFTECFLGKLWSIVTSILEHNILTNPTPKSLTLTLTLTLKWYQTDTILLHAEVSFQRHAESARATNTQQIWRQEFLGSRSSTVERSSTRTAAAGTFLRFSQTIFENTSLATEAPSESFDL